MSKNKGQKEAKKAAWAAKKHQEENKVIGWIFGVIIGAGVLFMLYTAFA